MTYARVFAVAVVVSAVSCADAQFVPDTQERSVSVQSSVSSGASSGGSDAATNFGPFNRVLTPPPVTGAGGASANGTASQNSSLGASLITGSLGATCAVATGSTFVTGESDSLSSFLYIFSVASPTQVSFLASGNLSYVGRNPDGEPSDLSGTASVRLLDGNTSDLVAGFVLFDEPGSDSATFNGVLPAGNYVILATARMHAFSADLLGPPARSGSGNAQASFTLEVVPAPGATGLLAGAGLLAMRRRRR